MYTLLFFLFCFFNWLISVESNLFRIKTVVLFFFFFFSFRGSVKFPAHTHTHRSAKEPLLTTARWRWQSNLKENDANVSFCYFLRTGCIRDGASTSPLEGHFTPPPCEPKLEFGSRQMDIAMNSCKVGINLSDLLYS